MWSGSVRGTSYACARCGRVTRRRVVRAYANLGEQSRYRRFFTVMPELPEATLKAAVEVDHPDHEALVAMPLLSRRSWGSAGSSAARTNPIPPIRG